MRPTGLIARTLGPGASPSICPACLSRQRRQLQHLGRPARRHLTSSTAATAAATASTRQPPRPPPAHGIAALPSRRLISISGVDAPKFLQGIITSNISTGPSEKAPPREEGFYTGFLNAQGRILHDAFIYPDTLGAGAAGAKFGHSFLIEVDAHEAERLERHIKRFKLRSKFAVRLLDAGEFSVWHAWDDRPEAPVDLGEDGAETADAAAAAIVLRDTRAPAMGHRLVTRGDHGALLTGLAPGLQSVDEAAYTVRRYLRGVPEGQDEMPREHSLPLDSNMDVMGGIDFRKGCYVGQELTIRTRHRGVVRKRILPCALYGPDRPAPERLVYRPAGGDGDAEEDGATGGAVTAEMIPGETSIGRAGKKGRSAGKWLKGVGNIGLALCRLEIMTDVVVAAPGEAAQAPAGVATSYDPEAEFVMTLGGAAERSSDGVLETSGVVKVKAFVPDWLRQGIATTGHS